LGHCSHRIQPLDRIDRRSSEAVAEKIAKKQKHKRSNRRENVREKSNKSQNVLTAEKQDEIAKETRIMQLHDKQEHIAEKQPKINMLKR
jgi:hypothetical protein